MSDSGSVAGLAVGDGVTSASELFLKPIIQFGSEGRCIDRGSYTYVNKGAGIPH